MLTVFSAFAASSVISKSPLVATFAVLGVVHLRRAVSCPAVELPSAGIGRTAPPRRTQSWWSCRGPRSGVRRGRGESAASVESSSPPSAMAPAMSKASTTVTEPIVTNRLRRASAAASLRASSARVRESSFWRARLSVPIAVGRIPTGRVEDLTAVRAPSGRPGPPIHKGLHRSATFVARGSTGAEVRRDVGR